MKRIDRHYIAPSYFEHNAGSPQVAPAVREKDTIEFTDETVQIEEISLDDLTPAQREEYDRAFK